jgi:Family of unknown function (DUF6535)/Ubiquitin carboxyl-terminal hydrolase
MRAFFAGGIDKMHIPWAVEGLPMLLHLSLFLFFGGLAIFLFNVDREVFGCVICWIGLFLMVYGMITLLPLIRHDSPYNSPLSRPAWFLYTSIQYMMFKIRADFTSRSIHYRTRRHVRRLRDRYQRWMSGGLEKAAEETVSKRSSEIDLQILDWTLSALGDDDSLKRFFEAIPGFFNSKLVKHLERDFPAKFAENFRDILGGFLVRTWSSNSVDDSEKARRLDISLNATDRIRETHDPFILHRILYQLADEELLTVDMGHTIASRITINDQDIPAEVQHVIASILLSVREKNDSWATLAARLYGLTERVIDLRGDDLSLAVLIRISRQYLRSGYFHWEVLEALSKLDISNTLPRLQHDFCTLWNEIVQEARNRGPRSNPVSILRWIRHLYITLHQGTEAAPTAFSASTHWSDDILRQPSSYPFCNLASHRPDSTAQVSVHLPSPPSNSSDASSHSPTDGRNTASRHAEQVNSVTLPTTSEIGVTSHGPEIILPTNPVHSSFGPAGASPTVVVAAAPQDVISTATLAHLLEGSEQQDSDIVAPSAGPETSQILSTTTHALAPIPISPPNATSESHDAGVATVSNSSHIAPLSIGSSTSASRPAGSATFPRLRPRGLVNTGNICFANAVLHLLVNLPPFWNVFRELGDLKAQRGAGLPETGDGATPLLDATVRFFKEFSVGEGSHSTQQRSQPATGGTSRADEEKKGDNVVDSFQPTYLYDAMKEKRQLAPLFVRSRAHVVASCY